MPFTSTMARFLELVLYFIAMFFFFFLLPWQGFLIRFEISELVSTDHLCNNNNWKIKCILVALEISISNMSFLQYIILQLRQTMK